MSEFWRALAAVAVLSVMVFVFLVTEGDSND